jgi:hypothetical protein
MRHCIGICQIVYGDNFYVRMFQGCPEYDASDSSESVDADLYAHFSSLSPP